MRGLREKRTFAPNILSILVFSRLSVSPSESHFQEWQALAADHAPDAGVDFSAFPALESFHALEVLRDGAEHVWRGDRQN